MCILCDSDKPIVGRKLCKRCYYRQRRIGTLDNFSIKNPIDKFESHFEKGGGCWEWAGQINDSGYGIWTRTINGKDVLLRAHRVSWEFYRGKIPDGMVACHKCDNRKCVNPEHIFLGTRLDNNRDATKKMRNAFGDKNGHAKLKNSDIEKIRNDSRPQIIIAKEYGIHSSSISRIKSGIRWNKI